MTKTLADMTAEERAKCVGMWCDNLVSTAEEPAQVVLACVQGNLCWVLHTDLHAEWSCFPLDSVAPRADLPRAWNPDGTPVKGEWVDGHMWWNEPGDDNQPVDLIGAECLGTGEMQGMDEWPENITEAKTADDDIPVRRFITEWENTND